MPRFSPSIYGPSTKPEGHKSRGNKRGFVNYSTDREDEVSKIFIIYLVTVCLTGSETISIREVESPFEAGGPSGRSLSWFLFMRRGLKFLKRVEGKTSQFEMAF